MSSDSSNLTRLAALGFLFLPGFAGAQQPPRSACVFTDTEIRPHMRSGTVGAVLGAVAGAGLGFVVGLVATPGEDLEGRGTPPPRAVLGLALGGAIGGFLGFQVGAITHARAERRLVSQCMRDAVRRAEQAAAEVDTILVRPDSLLLRVGERLPVYTLLTVEARSRSGDRVLDFAPLWRVEDERIARLEAGELTGRTPGDTRLIIRPFAGDPAVRVRPVEESVRIRVSP